MFNFAFNPFDVQESVKEKIRDKNFYSIYSQVNTLRTITQRTNSSIDKHISSKRKLLNEIKTNVSKLEKISNKAAQQLIGRDPATIDWRPFPIRDTYRGKKKS